MVIILLLAALLNLSSASLYASCTHELPIVVLICSYNNGAWVHKNLNSVFTQNYNNYRILYIDDCSTDDTVAQVLSYTQKYDHESKLTLIANDTRSRKMKNVYNAVHSCDDNEIIVQLDGDDWFCDDALFEHINYLYQTHDIWLTYGSYIDVPDNIVGYAQATDEKIIKEKSYRNNAWLYMPTRTFYAWLFKCIELKDFIAEQVPDYQGLFFPSADDPAFMFPMLEMAGDKFRFVSHISYVANRGNPLIGRTHEPSLQGSCASDVRSRKIYATINDRPSQSLRATTCMLIFSENNTNFTRLLESIDRHVRELDHLIIVTDDAQAIPEKISASCTLCPFDKLAACTALKNSQFVLITTDAMHITNELFLHDYVAHLSRTGAYGFYFALDPKSAAFAHAKAVQHVYQDIYAWKFNCSGYALHNTFDMTLLRTDDFYTQYSACITHKNASTLSVFKTAWLNASTINRHQVGLFKQIPIAEGTYTISSLYKAAPTCYMPPPGRGYRTPSDIERKRLRKIHLQEKREGNIKRERHLKKRNIPLS